MFNPQISTTMKLQFGELNITPSVVKRLEELGFTPEQLRDAVAEHKSECEGEPSLYVSTYAKYNEGCLTGLWIDLSSFTDYDEFIQFCNAIHSDEADPELMAQDYEGFPSEWYTEGFMWPDEFDNIIEYSVKCNQYGPDAVDDYMELHDNLDRFEDAYCGKWDSEEDFARHIIEECYDLERMMGHLAAYFDYKEYGEDLFQDGYEMGSNNYVFRIL